MPKSGYFISYYTNKTDVTIYLDNIVLSHRSGPLLQESDTYAFGGSIDALESRSFGRAENRYGYQGYHKNNDLDLSLYETFYRTHDPQLGRFWQIDPKAADEVSTYCAMDNNPILKVDFLGDKSQLFSAAGDEIGTINTKNGDYATILNNESSGLAIIAISLIKKLGITDEGILTGLENSIRAMGENYDLEGIRNFEKSNTTEAKYFDGHDLSKSEIKFKDWKTGETYSQKSQKAEIYQEMYLDGNTMKIRSGKPKTLDAMTTGPADEASGGDAYIHTHPFANGVSFSGKELWTNPSTGKKFWLPINSGSIPGGPSPEDKSKSGRFNHRSVVVDKSVIYLIQGDKKVIKIENHN